MAKSAFNHILDVDTAFRVPGLAAITANGATNSVAVALDKLDAARGDQRDDLAAEQYKVNIIVESLDFPVEFGSIVLSGALATNDAFTVDNGPAAAVQFVGDTDFTVGVSAIADAAALAIAINTAGISGISAHDNGAGTVYIENNIGTAGSITEDVDAGLVATVTDFAANDKTYTLTLEVDAAAFGSPVVVYTQVITAIGSWAILLDGEGLQKADASHESIRAVITIVDGTVNSASIAYAAWIQLL